LPPSLLPERWALTPPFHPYLRCVPFEDVPKVFLRAITEIRSAGGIFSVALSVKQPFLAASPGVTRRATLLALAKWCPDFPPASPPPPSDELGPGQRSSSSPAMLDYTALTRRSAGFHARVFRKECTATKSGYSAAPSISYSYFTPTSFSNSPSVRIVTPSSFALSYFDPGSVPTTT